MRIKSLVPWARHERGLARREGDPFAALQREMNALIDSFFTGGSFPEATLEGFMPRVDVTENDKMVKVTADLPGIAEKDVDITVEGDALTIKGKKEEEKEEKGEERYYAERSYGSFRRTIALPCEVDADKATASYKKGVLTIELPKAAQPEKGKKIQVAA